MHIKKRIELLCIHHAAASDGENSLRPDREGLEGWIPRLHQLGEEALHATATANTWDKLRKCTQDFTRRHHHGKVHVLLFEQAVLLQHAVPLEGGMGERDQLKRSPKTEGPNTHNPPHFKMEASAPNGNCYQGFLRGALHEAPYNNCK